MLFVEGWTLIVWRWYQRDCKRWMIIGVDKQCPRNLHYLCLPIMSTSPNQYFILISVRFCCQRHGESTAWYLLDMRHSCQHWNRRHEIVELIFLVLAPLGRANCIPITGIYVDLWAQLALMSHYIYKKIGEFVYYIVRMLSLMKKSLKFAVTLLYNVQ